MSRKRLTEEPQIVAAIISVIGTIVGTLLISVLLGFMEGRIALGALVAVISFLLLIAIWVLLVIRWGVRLAATAAAVMVIVGSVIFLIVTVARLIPIGVPVSTPVALAPSPTPQSKPALTPTPLPPAFTPSPFTAGPCRIAYEQDGDIYVGNCDGSGDYRLTDHPAIDANPAWSPDGQRIVFSSERDRQPMPDGWIPHSLYLVNADGSNLTRLTYEDEQRKETTNDTYSDWSPDGSRIAFHRNCSLAIINPDGSNLREVLKGSGDLCANALAWSPDGKRLAFASDWSEGVAGVYWTVYVVNADGTELLELKDFQAKYVRAIWSPDGSQVAFEVTYDAGTKYYLIKADGSGEPVEASSIPESWYPWCWPKWGGEKPAPAGPCRIAYEQDGDIYVKNCDGSGDYRLTDHPALDRDPAWSPDGQRIVFSSERERQPTPGYSPGSLYIVNADGSNLTRLTFEDWANDIMPDWSPDGSRIAFHRNGMLAMVNPDGSNLREILQESEELSVANVAWSPDGQRLAFANGRAEGVAGVYWTVCVVNADGTGLLESKGFEAKYVWAVWSPDGSQVAFEVTYDAGTKYYLMKADGSGEPVEASSIPESWHPWYWPKWGGEEKEPTPSASTAEEARAFVEPILAAIAGRPPDFSDDFSDPGSGWPEGEIPEAQGKQGYSGGEYFIQVSPDTCGTVITSRLPEISDFVLKMDGRFVSGSEGCWQVRFRISPDDDAYALMLHLGGGLSMDLQFKKAPQTVVNFQGPAIQPGLNQTNSLQIVAKGPQIAVVVNGEPLALIRDERLSRGSITLPVCNSGDTPLEVHFDNIEIWNISDLSLPSSADQASAFAEPILAAIARREPTWSDDFSDPKTGWPEGEIPEAQGKQGYLGGEYFIQVSPDQCGTAMTNRMPEFSDFVLEIDGRFDAQGKDYWLVHFRHTESGFYQAGIELQGTINCTVIRGEWEEITSLAHFDGPPVLSGPQRNHLQIIAKGPSIALAVNGEPLVLVQDERFQRGSIILVVCNKGPTSPTVYFDNLKVWDISDLSL